MLDCEAGVISVEVPVELHPERAEPEAVAKRGLTDVAALLARRRDVVLVRVEVCAASERRRAQARADTLVRWLTARGGVAAERLEALGREGCWEGAAGAWPARFVVMHLSVRGAGAAPGSPP